MAESLKKFLKKKRNKRPSSEELTNSPEAKKVRCGDKNFPEEIEESKTDDEIFTALNMAEGLHNVLEEINWKLEKLDAIQTTVNNVQTSLKKLEERMQQLESSQTTTRGDIKNLKECFKNAGKQRQESATSLEGLETHQKKINLALTELQKKNDELQAKLDEVENKNLYLEAYSRRENIIF